MGDTSETNTKVLSQEFFFGVVALKTPVQKNHYLRDMGYCHIFLKRKECWGSLVWPNPRLNFLEDNCHNMEEHKKVRNAWKNHYARAYYLTI